MSSLSSPWYWPVAGKNPTVPKTKQYYLVRRKIPDKYVRMRKKQTKLQILRIQIWQTWRFRVSLMLDFNQLIVAPNTRLSLSLTGNFGSLFTKVQKIVIVEVRLRLMVVFHTFFTAHMASLAFLWSTIYDLSSCQKPSRLRLPFWPRISYMLLCLSFCFSLI